MSASRAEQLRRRAEALRAPLSATAADLLVRYVDAMLALNRTVNLTAIRDPDAADVLHALDAAACGALALRPARVLDLGSGNGFPGVAVAALHPGAEVTLLERTQKKARALEALTATVGLANTRVLALDAAQAPTLLPALRTAFDVITARAVAAPAQVAKLAQPLLTRDGQLVLWLDADASVAELRGWRVREQRYRLPEPCARTRRLAVLRPSLSGRGR